MQLETCDDRKVSDSNPLPVSAPGAGTVLDGGVLDFEYRPYAASDADLRGMLA